MRFLKQLFSKTTLTNRAKQLAQGGRRDTPTLAFIAPATGMMQPMGASTLERLQNKMTGDGITIVPHGNKIVVPVSGVVVQSSAAQMTIRLADDTEVIMTFGGSQATCAQLATYSEKQQLWAGDIVGTIALNELVVPENLELYIIWPGQVSPRVAFGMVYASQSVNRLPEPVQTGAVDHD